MKQLNDAHVSRYRMTNTKLGLLVEGEYGNSEDLKFLKNLRKTDPRFKGRHIASMNTAFPNIVPRVIHNMKTGLPEKPHHK